MIHTRSVLNKVCPEDPHYTNFRGHLLQSSEPWASDKGGEEGGARYLRAVCGDWEWSSGGLTEWVLQE